MITYLHEANIGTEVCCQLSLYKSYFITTVRHVATCKPDKPGLTSFSEALALFFIQFLSFWKIKVQDRQNGPSGLPEKNCLAMQLTVKVTVQFE